MVFTLIYIISHTQMCVFKNKIQSIEFITGEQSYKKILLHVIESRLVGEHLIFVNYFLSLKNHKV